MTSRSRRAGGSGKPADALPQAERVHLVVVEQRGGAAEAQRAAVSGAPVDAAADDRGAAGDRLPGVRPGAAQGVREAGGVSLGRVDAPPVGGRAVLDAGVGYDVRRTD